MRRRALVVLVGLLAWTGRAGAQLADNNRGFPPNSTFATSGIDHVNLFSGNVVVTLPVGPNYPIGAGFSQQLRLNLQLPALEPTFCMQ